MKVFQVKYRYKLYVVKEGKVVPAGEFTDWLAAYKELMYINGR